MNIAKLKDQARKFESKDQFEKAITTYIKIIDELEGTPEMEDELSLLNKVGDLYLKKKDTNAAVEMYERAADHYKNGGLPNNAIALYNKVLRSAPSRTDAYLRLGELLVGRGFIAEAKRNFVQYFERMEKDGRLEDAFGELKKIADNSEDNEELRLLLAEHLKASARTDEAREQLAALYAEAAAQGDEHKARATLEKMQTIDPDFDPEGGAAPATSGRAKRKKTSDIVFLDLESGEEEVLAPVDDEPVADALEEAGMESESDAEPEMLEIEGVLGQEDQEPAAIDGLDTLDAFEAPEDDIPDLDVEAANPSVDSLEVENLLGGVGDDSTETAGVSPEPVSEAVDEIEIEMPDFDLGVHEEAPSEEAPSDEVEIAESEDDDRAEPDADIDIGGDLELEMPPDVTGDETDEASELILETASDDLELEGSSELALDIPDFDSSESSADTAGMGDIQFEGGDIEIEEETPIEVAPPTLDELEEAASSDPDNAQKRHDLAEALIEDGDQERGLQELDKAVELLEGSGENQRAVQVLDEALRLDSNDTGRHRKKVELLSGMGDNEELVLGYLAYADALLRSGDMGGARTAYQKVLDQDPSNSEAQTALETVVPEETEEIVEAPDAAPTTDFVDLGELIFGDDDFEMDTRMKTDAAEPSGDEDADFKEMLGEFKKGIAANIEEDDSEAHYDLGVAFKEMDLLDEAISEFQKALRGSASRLKASEALGTCFFEKGQFPVASTVLRRAIDSDDGGDEKKIGLLYWLARCEEEQNHVAEALAYYQRVFAVDINFQDVGDRVKNLA